MNGIESEPLTVALVSTQRLWQGGEEQAWQLACGLRHSRPPVPDCGDAIEPVRGAPGGGRVRRRSPVGQAPFSVAFVVASKYAAALGSGRRALQRCPRVDARRACNVRSVRCGRPSPSRRAAFAVRSPMQYRRLCQRLLCVSTTAAERCISVGVPQQMVRVVHDGVDPSRMAAGNRDAGQPRPRSASRVDPVAERGFPDGLQGPCGLARRIARWLWPSIHRSICVSPARGKRNRHCGRNPINFTWGPRDPAGTSPGRARPDSGLRPVRVPLARRGAGLDPDRRDVRARPIVTTSGGGILDVVGTPHHGRSDCAWIAPPAAPTELAQAILRALAHPDRCSEDDRGSRTPSSRKIHDRHMVDATLHAYRDLLASRSR